MKQNEHRMISLIGKYLGRHVNISLENGSLPYGKLLEIKAEKTDNYLILETSRGTQYIDGSRICSFEAMGDENE